MVADFGAFYELVDKAPGNLVFDMDPRRTSQTGVAQLPPGGAYPTDPEKPAV